MAKILARIILLVVSLGLFSFFSESHSFAVTFSEQNDSTIYFPVITQNYSHDRIAFTALAGTHRALYVINSNGTNQKRLTPENLWVVDFVWSPLGDQIAFTDQSNGICIYLINLDGSGLVNLATQAHDPAWSPDGTTIAFETYRPPEPGEIYTIKTDGTNLQNITNSEANENSPVWSPLGTQIAFVSYSDQEQGEINLINADGTQRVNLTNNPANDFEPTWSPDGSKIAFISDRDGNWEIYVVNVDGTGLTNLTNHSAWDNAPVWSPDGSRIAFVSTRDGGDDVFVMNADGHGQSNLSQFPLYDGQPSWSPNGTQLSFVSARNGGNVWIINVNGTGLISLTQINSVGAPKWRP